MKLDPHKILGVGKGASIDEIRRAYRKLASRHHPDQGGDAWAFQMVNEAYRILLKKNKRKEEKSQSDAGNSNKQPDQSSSSQTDGSHSSSNDFEFADNPFQQTEPPKDIPKWSAGQAYAYSNAQAQPNFAELNRRKKKARRWLAGLIGGLVIALAFLFFFLIWPTARELAKGIISDGLPSENSTKSLPKLEHPPVPSPVPSPVPEPKDTVPDPIPDPIEPMIGEWFLRSSSELHEQLPQRFVAKEGGDVEYGLKKGRWETSGDLVRLTEGSAPTAWKIEGHFFSASSSIIGIYDGRPFVYAKQDSAFDFDDVLISNLNGMNKGKFEADVQNKSVFLIGLNVFRNSENRISGLQPIYGNEVGERRNGKVLGRDVGNFPLMLGCVEGQRVGMLTCHVDFSELNSIELAMVPQNGCGQLIPTVVAGNKIGKRITFGTRKQPILGIVCQSNDLVNSIGAVVLKDDPNAVHERQNLLQNATFDDWQELPPGWGFQSYQGEKAILEIDKSQGHESSPCICLKSYGQGSDSSVYTKQLLTPNTRYRFSAWVKTRDVQSLQRKPDLGATINLHQFGPRIFAPPLTGSNDWRYIQLDFESEERRNAQLNLLLGGGGLGEVEGTIWFDDIWLEELGPSTSGLGIPKTNEPSINPIGRPRLFKNEK